MDEMVDVEAMDDDTTFCFFGIRSLVRSFDDGFGGVPRVTVPCRSSSRSIFLQRIGNTVLFRRILELFGASCRD